MTFFGSDQFTVQIRRITHNHKIIRAETSVSVYLCSLSFSPVS